MEEESKDTPANSMVYAVFTLISALCISAVAGYYSVVGLMAIFSGAALSIAIMGGVLELGKLVTASWLYNNWKQAPNFLKIYLSGAVVILMLITSMGIFGYLSKAHLAQLNPIGDVSAKVESLDFEIGQEQKKIDRANHILEQFDAATEEYIKRGYVTRAVKQRAEQKPEIDSLQKEIKEANVSIDGLAAKKFEIQKELRGFEAEVGPVKYIAQLVYGEKEATSQLDKTVRFVIIFLIFVFDPLAVLLVIAGNMSIRNARQSKLLLKQKPLPSSSSLPLVVTTTPTPSSSTIIITPPKEEIKAKEEEIIEVEVVEAMPSPTPIVETPPVQIAEEEVKPEAESSSSTEDINAVMTNAIAEATTKIPFNLSGPEAGAFRRALLKSLKEGLLK